MDANWRNEAACKGVTNLFYPPTTGSGVPILAEWQPLDALRICARCPVVVACLEHSLATNERHGIWGGAGGEQRRPLLRAWRHAEHPYEQGCECEWCRTVDQHLRRLQALSINATVTPINRNTTRTTHGKPSTYARGCHCESCKKAHKQWRKTRQDLKTGRQANTTP